MGTEEEPFAHQAIISLYGHPRSLELPVYGTKAVALREGSLDLHGMLMLKLIVLLIILLRHAKIFAYLCQTTV